MRYFCTYFDSNYLTRGLALHYSLIQHCRQPFMLWILALDAETHNVLSKINLANVRIISMRDIESVYSELPPLKKERNRIEYVWTCKPALVLYVMDHYAYIDQIMFLDCDTFFFDDPQPIFNEIGAGSIMIVDHRFPPAMQRRAKRGIYNVGILAFRQDASGMKALRWWYRRCLEWCFARVEDGRYAEQGYLNDWPTRFENVVVLQHKGVNVGPWNWMNYQYAKNDQGLKVDDVPLIHFHFSNMHTFGRWIYDTGLSDWHPMPYQLRHWIYTPYIQTIKYVWGQVRVVARDLRFADRIDYRFSPRVFLRSWRAGQLGWIK